MYVEFTCIVTLLRRLAKYENFVRLRHALISSPVGIISYLHEFIHTFGLPENNFLRPMSRIREESSKCVLRNSAWKYHRVSIESFVKKGYASIVMIMLDNQFLIPTPISLDDEDILKFWCQVIFWRPPYWIENRWNREFRNSQGRRSASDGDGLSNILFWSSPLVEMSISKSPGVFVDILLGEWRVIYIHCAIEFLDSGLELLVCSCPSKQLWSRMEICETHEEEVIA